MLNIWNYKQLFSLVSTVVIILLYTSTLCHTCYFIAEATWVGTVITFSYVSVMPQCTSSCECKPCKYICNYYFWRQIWTGPFLNKHVLNMWNYKQCFSLVSTVVITLGIRLYACLHRLYGIVSFVVISYFC